MPQRQSRALLLASSRGINKSEEKPIQLAMIGVVPFQYFAKQKSVEVFIISIQDIEYQLSKDKKPPTDPATKVLECYHNFFAVFLKETSNNVSAHSKHNHVTKLLSKKDHGQSTLHGLSNPQLVFVKTFFKENLKKGFIKASSALCSSPILLANKPEGGIRFCVDY